MALNHPPPARPRQLPPEQQAVPRQRRAQRRNEDAVSLKDKLEVGLKPDAPYRPDNLPQHKQDDPACQEGGSDDAGRGSEAELARQACDDGDQPIEKQPGGRRPMRAFEDQN
jgi:hypothetical protein